MAFTQSPEIQVASPQQDAEQAIAERVKTRNSNTAHDSRGFLALELIADEMTRLRAEVAVLRHEVAAYARTHK